MRHHVRAFRNEIGWHAARLVIGWAQCASPDRADKLGELLGSAAWHLMPRRRRIACDNAQCLDDANARLVARRSFAHFGRTLVEALRLPDHAPGVRWRTPDYLAPFIERRQAAVIVGGHVGNWEVAAWAIARRAGCLHLIVAPPSGRHLAAFLERHRRRWGVVPHARDGSIRPVMRALKDGGLVGTAADQWPGEYPSVEGKFFGSATRFGTGILRIALRARSPIIALAAVRTEAGFEIVTEPVWNGKDPVPSPEELVHRWVAILETQIRRCPEQYLWMHNRWKALRGETTPLS